MNWVDFVSILPFYLEFAIRSDGAEVLGTLRLLKVLRVFKMARHFQGSKVIARTLRSSARALWVFFCMLVVFVALVAYLCLLYTSPSPRDRG